MYVARKISRTIMYAVKARGHAAVKPRLRDSDRRLLRYVSVSTRIRTIVQAMIVYKDRSSNKWRTQKNSYDVSALMARLLLRTFTLSLSRDVISLN